MRPVCSQSRAAAWACDFIEYSTKQYNLSMGYLKSCLETCHAEVEIWIIGVLMLIHLGFMRGNQDVIFVHLHGAYTLLTSLTTYSRDAGYLEATDR